MACSPWQHLEECLSHRRASPARGFHFCTPTGPFRAPALHPSRLLSNYRLPADARCSLGLIDLPSLKLHACPLETFALYTQLRAAEVLLRYMVREMYPVIDCRNESYYSTSRLVRVRQTMPGGQARPTPAASFIMLDYSYPSVKTIRASSSSYVEQSEFILDLILEGEEGL